MNEQPRFKSLESLQRAVRDALISRFGEAYHEISWHVCLIMDVDDEEIRQRTRLPCRITVGELNHRTSWAGPTLDKVFEKFKVTLPEFQINQDQGDNLDRNFNRRS